MTDDNIIRKAYRAGPAKTGKEQGGGSRWKKGQSGNPRGCPQGSRHKATLAALALMEEDLENITAALIDKAKAGEPWAIKLILDKLVAPARDQPITFPAPRMESTGDLRAALGATLRAVGNGIITPGEAVAVAQVMNALGVALAVEDLEAQLHELQGGRQK